MTAATVRADAITPVPPFDLQVVIGVGAVSVFVVGELDLASTPRLVGAVRRFVSLAPSQLVLDLCGVTFIDATGISSLVEARNALQPCGCQLRLRVSDCVDRLLALTCLRPMFVLDPADDLGRC